MFESFNRPFDDHLRFQQPDPEAPAKPRRTWGEFAMMIVGRICLIIAVSIALDLVPNPSWVRDWVFILLGMMFASRDY